MGASSVGGARCSSSHEPIGWHVLGSESDPGIAGPAELNTNTDQLPRQSCACLGAVVAALSELPGVWENLPRMASNSELAITTAPFLPDPPYDEIRLLRTAVFLGTSVSHFLNDDAKPPLIVALFQ